MSILCIPRGPGKTAWSGVFTSCCHKMAVLTSHQNLETKSPGSHLRSHVKKKKKKEKGKARTQHCPFNELSLAWPVRALKHRGPQSTPCRQDMETSSSSSIHTRRVALSESPSLSFLLNLKKWDDSSCLTKVWGTKLNKGKCLAQSRCFKKILKWPPAPPQETWH